MRACCVALSCARAYYSCSMSVACSGSGEARSRSRNLLKNTVFCFAPAVPTAFHRRRPRAGAATENAWGSWRPARSLARVACNHRQSVRRNTNTRRTKIVQGWPQLRASSCFRALIEIFSQRVGPSLAIWTNPIQFLFENSQATADCSCTYTPWSSSL